MRCRAASAGTSTSAHAAGGSGRQLVTSEPSREMQLRNHVVTTAVETMEIRCEGGHVSVSRVVTCGAAGWSWARTRGRSRPWCCAASASPPAASSPSARTSAGRADPTDWRWPGAQHPACDTCPQVGGREVLEWSVEHVSRDMEAASLVREAALQHEVSI